MNSFAYAQVGGSLGKDPESRSTPNGTKVVNFSLAVEKGFGDNKHTEWFNCVCFKDVADFAEKYLKKGKGARVTGELQVRSWDDKQTGQKRYSTEVVASKIDFMDSGSGGSKSETPSRQPAAAPTRQQAAPPPRAAATDDPFADDEPTF